MRLIEVQYHRVGEHDRFDWAGSREGPFDSAAEAIRFAKSECGLPKMQQGKGANHVQ